MADTPYIGESVPGEAMPTPGYVWDFSPIQQATQDLTNLFASAQLKRAEKAQKAKEYWQSSMQEMPSVWDTDYEYVRGAVDEYNNLMKNFMNRGKDVSNLTPEEYKQYKEAENKVVRYTKAAEDNQKFWTEAFNQKEKDTEGNYDSETFESFKERYLSSELDPIARAQYRNSNDAFIRDYDWDEILEYTVPRKTTQENGRIITSEFKPEDHKAYLDGLFGVGDTKTLDMFWAIKRDVDARRKTEAEANGDTFDPLQDGYTQQEFVDQAVNLGKSKYNYTRTEEEASRPGGGGNRGGGSGGGNKVTVYEREPSEEGSDPKYYNPNYKPRVVQGANATVNSVDVDGGGTVNDFSVDYFTKDSSGKIWAYGNYSTRSRKANGWVDYNKFKGAFDAARYPDMTKQFGGSKSGGTKFNG